MKSTLLLIAVLLSLSGQSQSIKNIKAAQDGTNVQITYDLEDPEGKDFYIKAYASNDAGKNFNIGLMNAVGDVNAMVKTGLQKKITWHAMEDVGEYQGMMRFKIVGLTKTALATSENKDFVLGIMDITNVSRDKVSIGISLFCKNPLTTAMNDQSFMKDNYGNIYKIMSGLISDQPSATQQAFASNETKYGEIVFQISKRHPQYVGGIPNEFQLRLEYDGGGALFIPNVKLNKK